jgi:hypothetical protein
MAEELMSILKYRNLIARAAVVVALLSSRPTDGQVVVAPGPALHAGGLLNAYSPGVRIWPEVVGLAKAERHLQYFQAKYRSDAERGDLAAVDRDICRIDNARYRISINEWLIQKNLNQEPCFYPHPIPIDCVSRAAIADAARPVQAPYFTRYSPTPGPMGATPMIPITILNAEPTGAGVAFAIDGVAHQAAAGSRQDLSVATDSSITYDGGGSIGRRRYRISPGLYQLRSTAEGWALYKLPDMP